MGQLDENCTTHFDCSQTYLIIQFHRTLQMQIYTIFPKIMLNSLQVTLTFDLYYRPPDRGEADLDIDRFDHSLADLQQVRSVDDLGDGDVDFGEDALG